MVNRPCQFQVSKIARVGFIVQIAQTGIIGASIDRLTVDLGFVPRNTGGDFASIDGNGLGDGKLALQFN
jgi:hypothetical protein